MIPGNSTFTGALRKSVLVPWLTATPENPFGSDPRMAPEPVSQKKTSMFTGTLGMTALPRLTEPLLIELEQSDTCEENTRAMPRKFPLIVTVAVSELEMLLTNPLEPNTGTLPTVGSVVWADIAMALITAVSVSGEARNSVALDGGVSSMN